MKYGLTAAELNFLEARVVVPLKSLGAKVFLFGSRANGTFSKFSDIDLLFTATAHGKVAPHEIQMILANIDESDFPYKIDLVDEAELASSYKAHVNREKIEL